MKKIKGFVELALHLRYNIEIRARSSGSGVVLARLDSDSEKTIGEG
jgi:hypothetical protein